MDSSSLQHFVFFFLPILTFTIFLLHNNPSKKSRNSNPNPAEFQPYPLLGNLPQLFKYGRDFLDWSTRLMAKSPTHTIVVHIPGQTNGVITANPVNIEHILKNNFSNYPKGPRAIAFLEDFLGHGIFNSDGEHWNWQRKAASYEFNKKSLRNFAVDSVQHEIGQRLLPLLAAAGERKETLDLQEILERFSFDNICKVTFGEDPRCLTEPGAASDSQAVSTNLVKAFGDASHFAVERFRNDLFPFAWRIKKLLNIGSERQLNESIAIVNDFATKIIRSRKEKQSPDPDADLLSRFALNKSNSEEYLRDIVISFIVAGLETTSSALTWFFWQLSSRPDVEEKIVSELKAIRAKNPTERYEAFGFDELREMHYLHAALSESLRLYPPIHVDTQQCREDDVLPDGTFVGKGWSVMYSAYAVGRLKEVWGEDCLEFRPERWMEKGEFRPESPFRFPVFHAGPRMCLGKEMAYVQMKAAAAAVLEMFTVEVLMEKEKPPEKVLWLTLRMKGGLPVRVSRRGSCTNN